MQTGSTAKFPSATCPVKNVVEQWTAKTAAYMARQTVMRASERDSVFPVGIAPDCVLAGAPSDAAPFSSSFSRKPASPVRSAYSRAERKKAVHEAAGKKVAQAIMALRPRATIARKSTDPAA